MASGDAGGVHDVHDMTDPRVGQILGERYRLVRRLEVRGGGARYEALNTVDGRVVDVELLRAEPASADAVARFLETARTVARVGHDNVVQIFNGGRAPGGDVFLSVEHLEGDVNDLARVLATEPPLPWDRAQSLLLQLASALGVLHKHGLVHGDLRPESVRLVARQGRQEEGRREFVKLRDIGTAQLRAPATVLEPRTDVQALGKLAYHLVTGAPPSAESGAPAPTSLRPAGTLPTDLDGVLLRALEREPERRWPDMATFAEAVARCRLTRRQSVRVEALAAAELAGNRAASGAFEAATQRRHRAWSVVSVVAAVGLATFGLRVLTNAPGHVQITTLPADAELTFNGMPVSARSPVVLDAAPGHYVLIVSRAGFATAERTVDVTARAKVDVAVELPPAAPPTSVPPTATGP
jgi:hypothetical protein